MLKKIFLLLCSLTFSNLSYGAAGDKIFVFNLINFFSETESLNLLDSILTELKEKDALIDMNEPFKGVSPLSLIILSPFDIKTKQYVIATLLKHGSCANKYDENGCFPLLVAINQQSASIDSQGRVFAPTSPSYLDLIRLLIQNGADPLQSFTTNKGVNVSPLSLSILNNNIDVVDILIADNPSLIKDAVSVALYFKKFNILIYFEEQGHQLKVGESSSEYAEYQAWKAQQQRDEYETTQFEWCSIL